MMMVDNPRDRSSAFCLLVNRTASFAFQFWVYIRTSALELK